MNVQKVFCKLFTLYHATQFLRDNEKKMCLYTTIVKIYLCTPNLQLPSKKLYYVT